MFNFPAPALLRNINHHYLHMLLFYIKSALRNLYRRRLSSALNVTGLAIGISFFLLGMEFCRYEWGFNKFHSQIDRLYRVIVRTPAGITGSTFPTMAPLMEGKIPGVGHAVRFGDNFNDGALVAYQPEGKNALRSFREEGCVFVDPSFLEVFHFPMLEGRPRLDQPNTVVITADVARQLFGQQAAVGKQIRLHNQFGNLPLTVTGVVADVPDQSDIRFRLLLPIRTLEDPKYTEGSDWAKLSTWGNDAYTTYVRLDANANPAQVARQATILWQQNDPAYDKKKGSIELQPLPEMHLGTGFRSDLPTYSSFGLTAMVFFLSVLILCIAWVNYINFATADALTRAREIGIHKVIGSSRWQIVSRSIVESILLNILGLLLALSITRLTQQLFNYITERPLSLHYINQLSTWVFILGFLTAGSLLGGGYTGWLLSGMKPVTAMQFNQPHRVGNTLVRKILVVFQLTVSCIFIAGTLIAWRQVNFMKRHDLGMNIDHLVVVNGPAIRDSGFKIRSRVFQNEIAALPFVERLSCSGSVPGIGSGHNYSSDGVTGAIPRPGDEHINYSISEVDEHFFGTYAIPFVSGQDFTTAEITNGYKGDRLIINEKAALALGYTPTTAVGAVIHWDKAYRIAGVVRDYHHRSLKDPIEPILFIPQRNNSCYTIKTTDTALSRNMAVIRNYYESAYPGNTFTYIPLRESYDRQYADEQRTGVLAISLAGLVILISGLGLVGLAAFTARRRTKEMGIRKVLGASSGRLFLLLSAEYLWLVGIAFLIATPISWALSHRWLQVFAFRIDPDWTVWVLTGLSGGLITLLTVGFHALRTAFVNVVQQLRSE